MRPSSRTRHPASSSYSGLVLRSCGRREGTIPSRAVNLSMTLPTMLPHTRAEFLAWCRGIDDGLWTSLAVPERITYTSHDLTVQLAGAAAVTERVRLWTTI